MGRYVVETRRAMAVKKGGGAVEGWVERCGTERT